MRDINWHDDILATIWTDTCTLRSKTKVGEDSHKNAVYDWADAATEVSCRKESLSGSELQRELKVDNKVVIADFLLYIINTATVNESMRINDLTGESGETFEIAYIRKPRALTTTIHHHEVYIRKVKANA